MPDPSHPPSSPTARRRRRPRTIALITALLATALLPGAMAGPASAVPSSCDDGLPPPCVDIPDPDDPDDDPTPPPPGSTWRGSVSVLDQGAPALSGPVRARWARGGFPRQTTPTGGVAFSDPTSGSVSVPGATLPAGQPVSLVLFQDDSGPLCRTPPRASIPPSSSTTARVLVAPPVTEDADDLRGLVTGLTAGPPREIDDVRVTITEAELVPHSDGLHLSLAGTLFKDMTVPPRPNFDATFTYDVVLRLTPSFIVGDQSIAVTTVGARDLQIDPIGPVDSIYKFIKEWKDGGSEGQFRSAVVAEATSAVNGRISSHPEVEWFSTLGYSVSMRQIVTSDAGLTLHPSFCTLD